MAHTVCWGTLPFSGATTKGSLSPGEPQALYNKDPSALQTLLFTATLPLATVSIMHLFMRRGCSPLLCYFFGLICCGKLNSFDQRLFFPHPVCGGVASVLTDGLSMFKRENFSIGLLILGQSSPLQTGMALMSA